MNHIPIVLSVSMVVGIVICSTRGAVETAAPIAVPLAWKAFDGRSSDMGTITANFSDGRALEGAWARVTRDTPAEGAFVMTPEGEVSALELASPHRPVITAFLGDEASRTVCAFVGDRESEYGIRCIDRSGTRWTGSSREVLDLWSMSTFTGHLSVALHERR